MIVVVGIMTTVSKLISILASVVEYPKKSVVDARSEISVSIEVGTEAMAKRDALRVDHPIDRGILKTREELEKL